MKTDKLNRPLSDLRLSVIDACNFRCTYCMPADVEHHFMPSAQRLNLAEFKRIVSLFAQMGVRKVRLTGGEPLLYKDLNELIRYAKNVDGITEVCLTTNGSLLDQQAAGLKQAGLDRLTVSLDSLNPLRFHTITGGKVPLEKVLSGIRAAQDAGFENIKINCVVQKDVNDDEIVDLATFAREENINLRFIEFMDVGSVNKWDKSQVMTAKEILQTLRQQWDIQPSKQVTFGEVASRYCYQDSDLELGIIPSISQPFCGSCVRGRLSAKGEFFSCLFASKGFDLRGMLRDGTSDDSILNSMGWVWEHRDDRYSEEREELHQKKQFRPKVEMMSIGG